MRQSYIGNTLSLSIEDRKRAITQSKEFIPSIEVNIESKSRTSGTYAAFTTNLSYGIRGVYAASLKNFSLPMNFGNVLSPVSFNLTYTNVSPYPGNFLLSPGYYTYSINAGTVTYATAALNPTSNNLLYYILNWFSGGLDSLSVNPQNGTINWDWKASTGGATSTDMPAFFQLLDSAGLAWIGNGQPIDLSGCRTVGIIIPDLSIQSSKSNVVGIPNYFTSVPVNVGFGSVLVYEPVREDINWVGGPKTISSLSIMVVDTTTNEILPLVSDWSLVLRIYVSDQQNT